MCSLGLIICVHNSTATGFTMWLGNFISQGRGFETSRPIWPKVLKDYHARQMAIKDYNQLICSWSRRLAARTFIIIFLLSSCLFALALWSLWETALAHIPRPFFQLLCTYVWLLTCLRTCAHTQPSLLKLLQISPFSVINLARLIESRVIQLIDVVFLLKSVCIICKHGCLPQLWPWLVLLQLMLLNSSQPPSVFCYYRDGVCVGGGDSYY